MALDARIDVTWLAPVHAGGCSLRSYTARLVRGYDGAVLREREGVPLLPRTLTWRSGVENGTSYMVTVEAVNAMGASEACTSLPVVPAGTTAVLGA